MRITLSQHPGASPLPHAIVNDAPLASFEALARTLRAGARTHGLLWRRNVGVAVIARRAGACDALVTAALMHRLGELVQPLPEDGALTLSAAATAHLGADLLTDLYPPLVTETIRMHPSAQRYLATTLRPKTFRAGLGGFGYGAAAVTPMTELERTCFAALPFAMNAVRLARWSLAAAVDAQEMPGFERELPALYRIAERSVCNDGFGWAA